MHEVRPFQRDRRPVHRRGKGSPCVCSKITSIKIRHIETLKAREADEEHVPLVTRDAKDCCNINGLRIITEPQGAKR